MGKLSPANLKKTIYYLQRNGWRDTWYAARERLFTRDAYTYEPPSQEILDWQKSQAGEQKADEAVVFSLVVPAYRTNPVYLRELVKSVQAQTYPFWELIFTDATEDDSVEREVTRLAAQFKEAGSAPDKEAGSAPDKEAGSAPGKEAGSIPDKEAGSAPDKEAGSIPDKEAGSVPDREAGSIPDKEAGSVPDRETGEETEQETAWKIRYYRLPQNGGISANTNAGIALATGDYIGLLDHDDLLTPDALFEMADEIRRMQEERGIALQFLYSDEDKCDGSGTRFYEPNLKEKFNYDLLLSNNYICHFLVMKRELLQKLRLRPEYDGAQDYDLLLRAVAQLQLGSHPVQEKLIAYIPRVLYHWRCHETSTAENPQSKIYAYEAGKRALEAYLKDNGIKGKAVSLKHVGFYEVNYTADLFETRRDLGAVGGPVIQKGRIIGGRMKSSGKVYYENLPVHYSGYLHRAVLTQDARAVDIRNLRLRRELWDLFEQVTGITYRCQAGTDRFDYTALPANTDYKSLSLELCRAIRKQGYRILWRRENE